MSVAQSKIALHATRVIDRAAIRRLRGRALPYAFIAPIGILLLAVSVYPVLYAVWIGLTDASLLQLARARFIGLGNLLRMVQDGVFRQGLWRTVRWDAAVVLSELAIALPIALFLNLSFRGRGIVRAAVLLPYVIPPAVTALLWVYMVDGHFGVINDLLVRLHVLRHPVSWLGEPGGSFAVVSAAMVWAGQPLMAIILLAVMQSIPRELYEAAKVDGANAWQGFRLITLPHLMPTILFLLLLRTIWMSNYVDMIFIMTQGGPGFSNYTESVYSFMLIQQFDIGYASAVAVVLAMILMLGSMFYVRHLVRSVLA
jgi:multiple sugar transport system permease protein